MTSERVLFNLSHEKWKLLQTNLRIENTLDSYDYLIDDEYDLNLNQYTQMNFRLSPGVLWKKLSPLYFEYNLNHSLYATGNSTGDKSNYLWSAMPGVQNDFNTVQNLKTHYVKSEIRPNPNIYFYSLYEWNNQETSYDLSNLSTNYWRLSERFDLKLGFKTRVSLQYKQYYSNLGTMKLHLTMNLQSGLRGDGATAFKTLFMPLTEIPKILKISCGITHINLMYDTISFFGKEIFLRSEDWNFNKVFQEGKLKQLVIIPIIPTI